MRRIVSLWFPRWLVEQEPQGQGGLDKDQPFAVTWNQAQQQRIVAVNSAAARQGLGPGMPLADAAALSPDLATKPFSSKDHERQLKQLLRWAERYTPFAALQPPYTDPLRWSGDAGIFLDVTGAALYFKGEDKLMERIASDLMARGLTARLALAPSSAAAWALSRYATKPQTPMTMVAQDEALMPRLRDLPTGALRLPDTIIAELDKLGLRKLDHLFQQARASLHARFGPLLTERLSQITGDAPEPLSPSPRPDSFTARAVLAEPLISSDSLLAVLTDLLKKLDIQLAAKQMGVRELALTLFRVDGQRMQIAGRSARPQRDPKLWLRLLQPPLEEIDFGFGIEGVMLEACLTQKLTNAQEDWIAGPARPQHEASGSAKSHTALALDRIAQRLNPSQVLRWSQGSSHQPERSLRPRPWGQPAAKLPPEAIQALRQKLRPSCLFDKPEPAELEGKELVWRKRRWPLAKLDGPERIGCDWWLAPHEARNRARDYYRAVTQDGQRLWLFTRADSRLASHQPSQDVFVHGQF